MRVCLGGTFDILHAGHWRLLEQSFQLGDYVYIGLTTDQFASNKGRQIRSYCQREAQLERFIRCRFPAKSWDVMPLSDRYGPSVDGEFDAIVVSPATEATAREINRLRQGKGLKPLQVVVVPFLLAGDGRPVSSRRIALGEIDERGRVLARSRPCK
jgi:pantetheine-phosphate adenylyltransferase